MVMVKVSVKIRVRVRDRVKVRVRFSDSVYVVWYKNQGVTNMYSRIQSSYRYEKICTINMLNMQNLYTLLTN